MKTIKDIYRIGHGPSSSHTMGPRFAAERFRLRNPGASAFAVSLYGSLAATGKGHLTDAAIIDAMRPFPVKIEWAPEVFLPFHPNAMTFKALDRSGVVIDEWTVYSIGGGALAGVGQVDSEPAVYKLQTMAEVLHHCDATGHTFWQFVEENEGDGLWEHLGVVWQVMKDALERGVENEGPLPGGLKLARKASSYYTKAKGYRADLMRRSLLYAYALAVSEENAAGSQIVTAPTCGSCGVLPAVLNLLHEFNEVADAKILRALATAGLIGNLVKHNASISGADVGCQGEVGTACAMAAAAAAQLLGGTIYEVEYAAEMGLEHHLGLTCDPVAGLVQIPCIERNAFAAARALDCCTFALLSDGKHRVSFDKVVQTMKRTGHDLPSIYKETAEGGLAALKL
jgi:L-serine dehydratase